MDVIAAACYVQAYLTTLARCPSAAVALRRTAGDATPAALQAYIQQNLPPGWRAWATTRKVWIVAPNGHRATATVPAALQRVLRGRNRAPNGIGGLRVIA